jgi:hypothetical protein
METSTGALLDLLLPVLTRVATDTGAVFTLRCFEASQVGEVPKVLVLVTHQQRLRCLGELCDLGVLRCATFLATRAEGPCIVAVEVDASGTAIEARLRASLRDGLLDRLPLSAFDVALALYITLAAGSESVEAASRPRWTTSTFGERSTQPEASGLCVDLEGPEPWHGFLRILQRSADVQLWLPSESFEAPPRALQLRTPEELSAAFDAILEQCAAALAARRAFGARPFSGRHAGAALAAAFALAAPGAGSFTLSFHDDRCFPHQRPMGSVARVDGSGEHTAARIEETAAGVRIDVGSDRVVVEDAVALAAVVPALVDALRQDLTRLTPDKLRQGARYRLLRAAWGLPAGAQVHFEHKESIPYDGNDIWHFVRDDGGRFTLKSSCDADLDCLRQLQQYLQVA